MTRPRRRAAVLLAAVLVSGACSTGPSEPARPVASPSAPGPAAPVALAWEPCEAGFECAVLPVPLDESDPASGTVDLAVTRRTAPGDRIGSLVLNPGGPGASAVEWLQGSWESVPEPVRDRFDLVAFDPRGVGGSAPVRCAGTAELDEYFALDPEPDDPGELQAYVEGNRDLVEGCPERSGPVLAHMATVHAARDMERLRAALGDERLTYVGYSYGTSLGAAYLREFPERARAMVLDGAVDPALTWEEMLAGQGRGFDAALAAFLAHCERTGCAFRSAVRGDLGAAFDRLATRIDDDPLPGSDGRTVGPGEFSLGVGAALYSRSTGWPVLGEALAEAERGSGETLLALSDFYLERTDEGYANVNEALLAVSCVDRPWPAETSAYLEAAERVEAVAPRFGPAIVLSGLACAQWPVPPASEPAPVRAEGAPPVLVIGTTRDPATPYAWSQALAGQLASGVLLTYDGDGHTVYRAGAPACIREPVDHYLLTGEPPAAPVTC